MPKTRLIAVENLLTDTHARTVLADRPPHTLLTTSLSPPPSPPPSIWSLSLTPFLAQGGDRHLRGCQLFPHVGLGPPSYFLPILSTGDSWGMLACLCTVLWHLPAVPALNRTGDPGPGPSIQKTYDLTRYLEHQLRSLAGTYVSIPFGKKKKKKSRGFWEKRAWGRGPSE